jgi:hypothetical protein
VIRKFLRLAQKVAGFLVHRHLDCVPAGRERREPGAGFGVRGGVRGRVWRVVRGGQFGRRRVIPRGEHSQSSASRCVESEFACITRLPESGPIPFAVSYAVDGTTVPAYEDGCQARLFLNHPHRLESWIVGRPDSSIIRTAAVAHQPSIRGQASAPGVAAEEQGPTRGHGLRSYGASRDHLLEIQRRSRCERFVCPPSPSG